MATSRRGFLRGIAAAAATMLLAPSLTSSAASAAPVVTSRIGATSVRGVPLQAGAWEPLPLTEPTFRLFMPASGALLATTEAGLQRSDDAGLSWRAVPLPADGKTSRFAVDPNDHRTIYASSPAGVHRSDDEGATWSLILPSALDTLRIAISPASSDVIYVAQGNAKGAFAFLRSVDRGASWEKLEETTQGPCVWSVLILQPHASDPARLFRTQGCYAGRDLGDSLEQSRDQGAAFTRMYTPQTAFPHAIVGGGGAEPTRLYVASNNDYRAGGSVLVTSGDDGATWTPILTNTGGGTMSGANDPSTVISGLTYDPAAPGRVFVALERKRVNLQTVEASGVTSTTDGGQTWTPLGQQDLPSVHQLGLGIDGRFLFAATQAGAYRMALA